jgi:hypothetical protein
MRLPQRVKIGLCGDVRCMTAFLPRTDIRRHAWNVRLVPKAAVSGRSKAASLFDDLVGACEQRRRRNVDAKRFRCLS